MCISRENYFFQSWRSDRKNKSMKIGQKSIMEWLMFMTFLLTEVLYCQRIHQKYFRSKCIIICGIDTATQSFKRYLWCMTKVKAEQKLVKERSISHDRFNLRYAIFVPASRLLPDTTAVKGHKLIKDQLLSVNNYPIKSHKVTALQLAYKKNGMEKTRGEVQLLSVNNYPI